MPAYNGIMEYASKTHISCLWAIARLPFTKCKAYIVNAEEYLSSLNNEFLL